MELAVALIIVAASVAYVVWSVSRTLSGKSCHCSGCGANEKQETSR
ncbi:MAG: hypothetical protein K1Y02_02025 [Candidatus Hydrogenedentes bacterium]|nr:hypothetical protein [Candidatus Hydrogenedentota bacterium]